MSRHRIHRLILLCASTAVLSITSQLHAIQRFWDNPAGGSFTLGANWQGGVAPLASDDAYFGIGDYAHTVTFPANVSTDQLTILRHDVTFDLLGRTYSLTSAATDFANASFIVGDNVSDNAIAHITNGTLAANYTYIGQVGGSDDNLFVSTLGRFNATTLDIGRNGIGHLTINNGGIVNSNNAILGTNSIIAQGYALVDGVGSSWTNSTFMNIGNGRAGFLTIQNSGAVTTDTAFVNATSILAISGAASTFHSRNITISGGTLNHTGGNIQASTGGSVPATGIYVGLGGTGNLNVNFGGHLNTTGITSIGHFGGSNGTATLSGSGSNWTHAGEFNVGVAGTATLNINSGATASATGIGYIARGAGSAGTVAIDGIGSRLDLADDLFAAQGNSTINITNGGLFTDNNAFLVPGPGGSSTATIIGAGSQWRTAHFMEIAGSGGAGLGAATVNVGTTVVGGQLIANDSIKLWNLGRINQGSGEIDSASLVIQGGRVTQNGGLIVLNTTIAPFTSSGINIGTNATGNLNVSAGGRLNVTGDAYVGVHPGSTGDIVVDGAGSSWTNTGLIIVGDAGKGILTIDNGATVSAAGEGVIGFTIGSTGSVTVDGAAGPTPSSFSVGGNLEVGTFGTAFLTVSNQASVSSGTSFVGRSAGGKGTVKITDNNADWHCTTLFIAGDAAGPGGTGTVNVSNNGFLVVSGPITVWNNGTLQSYPVAVSTSELRLRGGKFSAWSNFNAPVNSAGGQIEVPGSNILFLNNTLTTAAGSTLQRIGTGDLFIMGPQFHSNSTFQARGGQTFFSTNAGSPATAALAANANLNVNVGPEPAKIVQMTNQVLRTLNVAHANAGRQSYDLNSPIAPGGFFSTSIYDTSLKAPLWAAISSANRAGAPDPQDGIFDSHLASHPGSGIGLAKLADAHGDSYLLIRPTRIGDLNLDGTVTISDFIDLAANFGALGVTWQEGDLNYDGNVSISDFIDLSAAFGTSYAGSFTPTPNSVPEPAALLLLATPLLLSHRRKRPL